MPYRYNPFTGNFDRVGTGSGAPSIETLTGNSGGAVGPDGAFNIDILGAGSITVTGDPGTNTLTIDDDGTLADTFTGDSGSATPSGGNLNLFGDAAQGLSTSGAGDTLTFTNADASETQKGVSELATDAESIGGADSIRTIVPTSLKAKLGVQTSNSLPFGQGDSTQLGWTSGLTDGHIVIGSTAGNPEAAPLTEGTGINIVNGSNSITISTSDSTPLNFDTDSGIATPSGNSLTIEGGTNINTSGSGATVTLNLDTNISVGTIDSTQLTIDPGASGDAFVQFDINSSGAFRIGVDDTDDSFRISQGSALGTNDTQIITEEGEITFPLTPAFLAYLPSQDTNVTGDGTIFHLGSGTALTEVFDQNSDFNTNGTFTAPVTGKYLFDSSLVMSNIGSGHTLGVFRLVTSNRIVHFISHISPAAIRSSADLAALSGSIITDMDAGDTARIDIEVSNSTLTVGVNGSSFPVSFFSGKLAC